MADRAVEDASDIAADDPTADTVDDSAAIAVDESTIFRTPMVELDLGIAATVYGKVEWFNLGRLPRAGSVKVRIARSMLDAAEAAGEIGDRTVIEASSGNTGSALARIGRARGYDVEVVMPEHAGRGKVEAIRAAGGEVQFVESERGYDAFVRECERRVDGDPGRFHHPDQYRNPANPGVHAGTTGPEIWAQTDGRVTHFVAGAGTGGTLRGVSAALHDRGVRIHGYEPSSGTHRIAGLKHMHEFCADVPRVFDMRALDSHDYVRTGTAVEWVRRLRDRHRDREIPIVDPGQWTPEEVRVQLRVDGEFLVGPSSGGAASMTARLADHGVIGADDVAVIPLPDRGDRYPERDL